MVRGNSQLQVQERCYTDSSGSNFELISSAVVQFPVTNKEWQTVLFSISSLPLEECWHVLLLFYQQFFVSWCLPSKLLSHPLPVFKAVPPSRSFPSSPHIQRGFHHRVKFPSFSHRSGKRSRSDIGTLLLKWTISPSFSNCCSQCPNSRKWLFFPSAWWTELTMAMSEIRGRRRQLKWAELSQGHGEEAQQ